MCLLKYMNGPLWPGRLFTSLPGGSALLVLMSQRSAGSCTRANTFPDKLAVFDLKQECDFTNDFVPLCRSSAKLHYILTTHVGLVAVHWLLGLPWEHASQRLDYWVGCAGVGHGWAKGGPGPGCIPPFVASHRILGEILPILTITWHSAISCQKSS